MGECFTRLATGTNFFIQSQWEAEQQHYCFFHDIFDGFLYWGYLSLNISLTCEMVQTIESKQNLAEVCQKLEKLLVSWPQNGPFTASFSLFSSFQYRWHQTIFSVSFAKTGFKPRTSTNCSTNWAITIANLASAYWSLVLRYDRRRIYQINPLSNPPHGFNYGCKLSLLTNIRLSYLPTYLPRIPPIDTFSKESRNALGMNKP